MTPWATSFLAPPGYAEALGVAAILAAVGALIAWLAARYLLTHPPSGLWRTNYRGAQVPSVLGPACVAGAASGLAVGAALDLVVPASEGIFAGLIIVIGLGLAGGWDDLRGDERPRGFKGHLGALAGGRVTGGLVKLLAGGVVGLAAAWIASADPLTTVLAGAAIALAANLINLLDRAPGRAGKAWLLLAIPVAASGAPWWPAVVGSSAGALAAVLPADIKEKGMLGDSGANPLGGMLGLGVVAYPRWAQIVAVAVLLALNLASERWSFGAVIDRTPMLRRLDRLGRRVAE